MKAGPVTNLGSIGGAPDPTTAPEVHTGMRKLLADQGDLQSNQPVLRLHGPLVGQYADFFSRATANFIFIFFLFLKLKLRFFARFFLPPATIFQNFAKAVSLRGG